MEFKELVAEFEKFKDSEEYNNYIGGLITSDRVGKYLESEDGKKFLQPTLDKYHNKGLESWKTNNLQKLLDEEIKKKFPDADPKDLELKKLQSEIENIKREASRKEYTNKALKIATEKGLPVGLIDYFIGEDEEITTKNLETFEKVFTESLSQAVQIKVKDTTYIPPAGGGGDALTGVEKAFYEQNPNLK